MGEAGGGCAGWRVLKGRKKWDNCNSIINNIYLKVKKIILGLSKKSQKELLSCDYGEKMIVKIIMLLGEHKVEGEVVEIRGNGWER